MNAAQKIAWFNLSVCALAVVLVLSLIPFLGKGAMGGWGVLGLLGLSVVLLRKKQGQVVSDERDVSIQRKSVLIAYSAFWILYILAAVLAPFVYGEKGNVPVFVVQQSAWIGFVFFYSVTSIATLIQYARGGSDGE